MGIIVVIGSITTIVKIRLREMTIELLSNDQTTTRMHSYLVFDLTTKQLVSSSFVAVGKKKREMMTMNESELTIYEYSMFIAFFRHKV